VAYAHDLAGDTPDLAAAMAQMPPLLRTYLAMGGWVSDHAVLDRDLDTLHVFTAVEIAAIPPARARALREIAGG
jgi:L-ornithine Nalpha-acyltransferase